MHYTDDFILFVGREKRDYLERALRDMSKDQKKDFFCLHDSKVSENEEKTVDGIWRTNNFALGQSGAKCDNGLFLRISRFNHSCVPVAEFVWNAEKRLQEIRAIRNIPAHTEITICYFTSLVAVRYSGSSTNMSHLKLVMFPRPQRERRQIMLEQYGFLCDCVACSLTGEERKENDESRRQVLRMDSVVEKLLYEFDEDEECDSTDLLQDLDIEVKIPGLSDLEMQGEERDVANAVILLFHKLSRMDTLGFKVVSQASEIILCSKILFTFTNCSAGCCLVYPGGMQGVGDDHHCPGRPQDGPDLGSQDLWAAVSSVQTME